MDSLLLFYALARNGKATAALFSLVAASLIFYGWWNPVYLVLLLFSLLVNYGIGSQIGKLRKRQQTQSARLVFYSGIVFNVGLLGYFKYTNFFVDSLNYTFDTSLYVAPIVLPLAISFFTIWRMCMLTRQKNTICSGTCYS
jgi:alginate O-acetyltransferase complex protein AlgI